MITKRTYTAVNGLNYIQASELAFATIYMVTREGIEYDPYISGSTSRKYIHTVSNGRVTFPTVFDGGGGNERVFVLFKPSSGTEPVTPPGVCVPVAITPITLAGAADGQAYLQTIYLTGTAPFVLSGITKPAWLTITNSGNTITLSGTPGPGDVTPSTLIEFTVTNCAGSTALFSQSIQVYAAVINFFVDNNANYGTQIINVLYPSGAWYTVSTGSFPVNYLQSLTGLQGGITDPIQVEIFGIVFPQTLTLYKNGIALQSLAISVNEIAVFSAFTFTSSDEMRITLT